MPPRPRMMRIAMGCPSPSGTVSASTSTERDTATQFTATVSVRLSLCPSSFQVQPHTCARANKPRAHARVRAHEGKFRNKKDRGTRV